MDEKAFRFRTLFMQQYFRLKTLKLRLETWNSKKICQHKKKFDSDVMTAMYDIIFLLCFIFTSFKALWDAWFNVHKIFYWNLLNLEKGSQKFIQRFSVITLELGTCFNWKLNRFNLNKRIDVLGQIYIFFGTWYFSLLSCEIWN